MQTYKISASALIDAPAPVVYGIRADYQNGHPHILPKPNFQSVQVERGGVGSGTAIYFEMRVLGRTQKFRTEVTEPEPGRILVETNQPGGAVTKFVVDPVAGDRQSQLEISTELPTPSGLFGPLERYLTTMALRPVYVKELALIASLSVERARTAAR